MMTGTVLSGTPPLIAAKYQLMIMFLICFTSSNACATERRPPRHYSPGLRPLSPRPRPHSHPDRLQAKQQLEKAEKLSKSATTTAKAQSEAAKELAKREAELAKAEDMLAAHGPDLHADHPLRPHTAQRTKPRPRRVQERKAPGTIRRRRHADVARRLASPRELAHPAGVLAVPPACVYY